MLKINRKYAERTDDKALAFIRKHSAGIPLDSAQAMVAFYKDVGQPWKSYKVIHVAGTNGKGSVVAMLSEILQAQGLRVGTLTSPALLHISETVRVNNEVIPSTFVTEQVERWHDKLKEHRLSLTAAMSALAVKYFEEQQVDVAVIETNVGGRLDMTNAIDSDISVFTSIDLDHEHWLGYTVEDITIEKAGIMFPGKPAVIGLNSDEVSLQLATIASKVGSKFAYAWLLNTVTGQEIHGSGQTFKIEHKGRHEYTIPLLGNHQAANLSTVLTTLDILYPDIAPNIIQRGLTRLAWPGRMEILSPDDPIVFYDTGHNGSATLAIIDTLRTLGYKDTTFVVAIQADKHIKYITGPLSRWDGPVIYCPYRDGSDSSMTYEQFKAHDLEAVKTLRGAIGWAHRQKTSSICYLGSFHWSEELYARYQVHT